MLHIAQIRIVITASVKMLLMSALNNKHIIVGITGGIAAYKVAELVRRLKERGAEVRVVMTAAATDFVTALTFQALSGHPVAIDKNANNSNEDAVTSAEAGMKHIELARWADVIIIAPASANTIAKLAQGRADNLLTTLCLASTAIKCFAPAMNQVMWQDLSTQRNCQALVENGWKRFGPASGSQACGEVGEGRLLEVSDLLNFIEQCFQSGELHRVNLVVTAGPTYEAIDPVRFIGNRSSGRMGYAIAAAAHEAGASVTLITGPSHLPAPESLNVVTVESARQMQGAVMATMDSCDIYISAAAVADYRVASVARQKIKKTQDTLTLQLVKNDDIISAVTRRQSPPYVVGFAAETENMVNNAKNKLKQKKMDMIVANDVSGSAVQTMAIGFNSEYNALHVFWTRHSLAAGEQYFDVARKSQLAKNLISLIASEYKVSTKNHAKNTA